MPEFGKKGLSGGSIAERRASFVASERARPSAFMQQGPQPIEQQPVHEPVTVIAVNEKSLLVAYALWFFASAVGAHRFYLGAWQSACFQAGSWITGWLLILMNTGTKPNGDATLGLLLMVAVSFWILADVFLIPGLKRKNERKQSQDNIAYAFT